jgi:hypothetical protein
VYDEAPGGNLTESNTSAKNFEKYSRSRFIPFTDSVNVKSLISKLKNKHKFIFVIWMRLKKELAELNFL